MTENLFKLLSEKRIKYEDGKIGYYVENIEKTRHYRTAFHKDYDRIIFSNPFRRLSKKTQVHPLSKNDHVHNRLTHSLETASVGRSLGLIIGSGKDDNANMEKFDLATIIQASCLAHDIGNPPFGHAGEDVIKSWFSDPENSVKYLSDLSEREKNDFRKFDGNAQSFRIVTQLENHLFSGGMQLTFSTLASMVKYPHFSTEAPVGKDKFSFFESEREIAEVIFKELGLYEEGSFRRYPLSYLMEISDDICYALLDLQDAVELGIIEKEETHHVFKKLCSAEEMEKGTNCAKLSVLCAYAINNLALHAADVFRENCDRIFEGREKDLLSLFENSEYKEGLEVAKKFARENIFNEKRKIELELGAYNTIGILLDNMIAAAHEMHRLEEGKRLSFKSERIMQMMADNAPKKSDSLYNKYLRVTDYIVGMTDNYAVHVAQQLSGMAH